MKKYFVAFALLVLTSCTGSEIPKLLEISQTQQNMTRDELLDIITASDFRMNRYLFHVGRVYFSKVRFNDDQSVKEQYYVRANKANGSSWYVKPDGSLCNFIIHGDPEVQRCWQAKRTEDGFLLSHEDYRMIVNFVAFPRDTLNFGPVTRMPLAIEAEIDGDPHMLETALTGHHDYSSSDMTLSPSFNLDVPSIGRCVAVRQASIGPDTEHNAEFACGDEVVQFTLNDDRGVLSGEFTIGGKAISFQTDISHYLAALQDKRAS